MDRPISSSSLSSSSPSSDEIIPEIRRVQRRRFQDRNNPFDIYNDVEFKKRFRLSKELVMNLLHEIGHNLEPLTKRSMSIYRLNQLLLCLKFYTCGSFQIAIGDNFHVHKSTACRII